MTKVTVAPVTSRIKGLSSEVPLGRRNGLETECAASIDNVVTVSVDHLGRILGYLSQEQEQQLASAIVLAYDLDIPLLS